MQSTEKLSSNILNLTTTISLYFTIFLVLFVFKLQLSNFDVALFTISGGPILYSLQYSLREKSELDEIFMLIMTYLFALIFFVVITHTFNYIVVFYALIVYIILKKLNKFLLELCLMHNIDVKNPNVIFIVGVLSSLIVTFLLINLILL